MINFEEELRKFHPSLEVEDAEEAIYSGFNGHGRFGSQGGKGIKGVEKFGIIKRHRYQKGMVIIDELLQMRI